MKKALSICLSALLIMSILPLGAFTVSAETSGTCGETLSWSYEDGVLTITGSGAMTDYEMIDYESYGSPWYEYRSAIQSVELPVGITAIGDYAFFYCENITEITLPASVTSIGDDVFYGCVNLKIVNNYSHLVITAGNSDNGYVGYYADTVNWFSAASGSCGDNLTYSFDATGKLVITGSGEMTSNPWGAYSSAIQSIELPVGITAICDNAFFYCENITEITLPASVTSIGDDAFYGCENLKIVNNYSILVITAGSSDHGYIGQYADTVNWYKMYSGSCGDQLTYTFNATTGKLIITGSGAMTDYEMNNSPWYEYRSAIQSIEVSNGVTSIGDYAFRYCENITEITLPASVTSIGDNAFSGCENLTSVVIPDSVTLIDHYAFYCCYQLSSIVLSKNLITIGSNAFYCTKYYNTSTNWEDGVLYIDQYLIDTQYNYEFPSHYRIKDGTRVISDSAFYGCENITEITLPASVNSIGDSAFYGCENLKTVNNYSNLVITAGSSDHGEIGWYADTVNWYGMDSGSCGDNLTYTFNATTGNLVITGSGEITSNPWNAYHSAIQSIELSVGITAICDLAFYGCENLKTVNNYSNLVITAGSSDHGEIGRYADTVNWYGINSGSCGDNLTYSFDATGKLVITGSGEMTSNPWYEYRSAIQSIELSNGITSIGKNAFYDCKNITEITLPASITSIGDDAFYGCENLKTVNNYSHLVITAGNSYNGYAGYYADTVNWFSTASGSCGDNLTYSFDATGKLVITGSGAMTDSPWYEYRSAIQSVELPVGITAICDYAFYYCKNITEITLPASINSIGDYAFYGCENLKTVNNYSVYLSFYGYDDTYVTHYATTINDYFIPTLVSITDTTVTLQAKEGYEYRVGSGSWQTSNVFTDLKPNSTYSFYQRMAANGHYSAGRISNALEVKTKFIYDTPSAPTLLSRTDTVIVVTPTEGYEYSIDGVHWQTSNEFTNLTPKTTYSVYQRHAGSEDGYASEKSDPLSVITKYTFDTPSAPTLASKTDTDVTLTLIAGCEYSKDGINWQTSNVFTNLNEHESYTFYQRMAATEDAYASKTSGALIVVTYQSEIAIMYFGNGGTNIPQSTSEPYYKAYISTTIPKKDGYIFIGWNSFDDGYTIYKAGDHYLGESDISLYAVWLPECENCHTTGKIDHLVSCSDCHGGGYIHTHYTPCRRCGSKNTYTYIVSGSPSLTGCYDCKWIGNSSVVTEREKCTDCSGSGNVMVTSNCSNCSGLGYCKPVTPKILSFSSTQVTLIPLDGYEYSKDGIHWQTSNMFTGLAPATEYTFYQRTAGTSIAPFGYPSDGVIQKTDKAINTNIPTSPTALNKTSSSVTLNDVDGCIYGISHTSNGHIAWQSSTTFSGLDFGRKYYFYLKYFETDTHYESQVSTAATITTDKSNRNAPSAPTVSSYTHNKVTLTANADYEYSLDGIHWQESNIFTGLSPLTTYTFFARYKETDRYLTSPASVSCQVKTAEQPLFIVGDLDENDAVTDADAVYLLMYTFFPEDYEVNQPLDFNEDGSVTDADAVYLLMYTFFPEDYPIN